ncbi:MAG: nucleotide exchange factor GrpE [Planctomycetes bacterium]|nr:nucleotide exchange factor GrpE [Planctomycetota bacterium]
MNEAEQLKEEQPSAEELAQLRARAQERDQYLDMLQRNRAEFENYQKRNQKDRDQERRYLTSNVFVDLLPVLDNLERAMAAAKQADEKGPLVDGVAIVLNQFLDVFKRHGVSRIEAEDRPFDPNVHQAVMQQPAADKPANTVIQVLEHGYTIHDRVLRPAKVIVSKEIA